MEILKTENNKNENENDSQINEGTLLENTSILPTSFAEKHKRTFSENLKELRNSCRRITEHKIVAGGAKQQLNADEIAQIVQIETSIDEQTQVCAKYDEDEVNDDEDEYFDIEGDEDVDLDLNVIDINDDQENIVNAAEIHDDDADADNAIDLKIYEEKILNEILAEYENSDDIRDMARNIVQALLIAIQEIFEEEYLEGNIDRSTLIEYKIEHLNIVRGEAKKLVQEMVVSIEDMNTKNKLQVNGKIEKNEFPIEQEYAKIKTLIDIDEEKAVVEPADIKEIPNGVDNF